MLEPPSALLLKTLSALKLCEPRDLRRCRGLVRRLTRDLPAFDSIWIDALVQTRCLTAFQAQCVEAGRAEQLVVGPCLLLERLGGSAHAETFLARRRDTADVGVLKLTRIAPEQVKVATERMERLLSAPDSSRHSSIVMPMATQVVEWPNAGDLRFVTISRYVQGPHLAELLIRRGRFPIDVVIEIGRQLIEALAKLETMGLVHGDLSLANTRITPRGRAVLLDAGLVSVLRPQFSFHTVLAAERYDTIAPERISNGSAPTPASDLFSLGCLLWHLLAGRPPFMVGDPLAKLQAHQTQPVSDIREWVPDVPSWLAETLLRWTAMNPTARPNSIHEAAAEFGSSTRAGRSDLRRFRGEFDRTIPRSERKESGNRWPLTVAAIFMMSGAVLSLANQGTRNLVLSMTQPMTQKVTSLLSQGDDHDADASRRDTTVREPQEDERSTKLSPTIPLPPPNHEGRIQLAAAGRYEAADVSVRGKLEIIGDPLNPPTILINSQSLAFWGEHVQLQHIRFIQQTNVAEQSPAMVVVVSQQLRISGCTFEHDSDSASTSSLLEIDKTATDAKPTARRRAAAVAWKPQEPRLRDETLVQMSDVSFFGDGPSVFFQVPPATFTATNVLKLGDGDMMQCIDSGRSDWHCELRQLTLRGNGPLLRCWIKNPTLPLSKVSLLAEGCVLDVRSQRTGPSAKARPTLVSWMAAQLPPRWDTAIEWRLTGVLVPAEIDIVSLINPQTGQRSRVDDSRLEIDGLVAAPFEFSGSASSDPADSVLQSFDAPLPAKMEVGITADRLLPAKSQR